MSVNKIIFCHYSSRLNIPTLNNSPKKPKNILTLRPPSKPRRGSSSSSSISANLRTFMDFPYVSNPQRTMMVDLVSTVETRLDPQLLPCTLPHDVRRYRNENGTSQASLHIRSGRNSSQVCSRAFNRTLELNDNMV